jgi:ABC-type nitrate/sulfonate/bicarbonate transport system permease component
MGNGAKQVQKPANGWKRFGPTIIAIGGILLFWQFFTDITGEPKYIVPPLSDVLSAAFNRSLDKLLPASFITAQEVLLGFVTGSFCGLLIATAIFLSATVRRAFLPIVIATQAVPVLAIAPILVIWLGFGLAPKVIVAALVVFFPVVINGIAGLNSTDPEMINLMRSLGAGGWQIFWKLRFPAALPIVFAGLKNAAAISAIGAIVGEWVGATSGLGPVMIEANASFKTATTFAAILYLAVIAIALFGLVALGERLALPWRFLDNTAR